MRYEIVTKTLKHRKYNINTRQLITEKEEIAIPSSPSSPSPAMEITPIVELTPYENQEVSQQEDTIEKEEAKTSEVPETAHNIVQYEELSTIENESEQNDEPKNQKKERKKNKNSNKNGKKKRKIEIYEKEDEDVLAMKAHIEDTINHDGYYAEIKPRDNGEKIIKKRQKVELWKIGLIAGLTILSVGLIMYSLGGILG